jgi:hypothetical protein
VNRTTVVIAALVPTILLFAKMIDAWVKPAHDDP